MSKLFPKKQQEVPATAGSFFGGKIILKTGLQWYLNYFSTIFSIDSGLKIRYWSPSLCEASMLVIFPLDDSVITIVIYSSDNEEDTHYAHCSGGNGSCRFCMERRWEHYPGALVDRIQLVHHRFRFLAVGRNRSRHAQFQRMVSYFRFRCERQHFPAGGLDIEACPAKRCGFDCRERKKIPGRLFYWYWSIIYADLQQL